MSPGDQTWTSGLIPMIEPEVVTEIISRISDLALVVSKVGKVLGVLSNPNFRGHSNLSAWEGKPLQDELTVESVPKFESRLQEFVAGEDNVLPLELNHRERDERPEFPMRYSFHRLGSDGAILLLGSDLRSTAEMQQQLVAAQIALEKDYESQRDHDLKFRVLMAATEDATVYVSASTGEIVEGNDAAATLFGKSQSELIGMPFAKEFEAKSQTNILDKLVSAASEQRVSSVAATTARGHSRIELHPTMFRTSGEQMLLCKISTVGAEQKRPDDLRENLFELFENGVDSIVFVGLNGNILSSNDAFLNLADVTHAQSLKGRSLAEFLSRGSIDLNVILENANRSGTMRLYATKIRSELGADRAIEISTSRLNAGGDTVFALIIRDASRLDSVRPKAAQVTDVDMRSVIELIGGQSLKDIVAKTTDVVEKMCIETAVEMTSNNRVAAAEMLGLSRQSLYVKLRKYGLINKDA